MTNCLGCRIAARALVPPAGFLAESAAFVVHQDPLVLIPGFLVIASKEHRRSIREFTRAEYGEFSELLFASRQAVADLDFCTDITIIQEERSSHFHCWLFPRYPWMSERFDSSLASIRDVMDFARKALAGSEAEAASLDLAKKLRPAIQKRMNQF